MSNMNVLSQLSNYAIVSDQIKRPALNAVLSQFETVLKTDVQGDVVEFGCYIGTTSLYLRRLLDMYSQSAVRELHVYDSFEGLPAKISADMSSAGSDFKAGELTVSKRQLLNEFHKANLRAPVVHKGWFNQLSTDAVPDTVAFAFLDGDFYTSILDSLRLVWPRMAQGGIICIDDYQREALPGVERAVRDYFQNKPYKLQVSHNIATIKQS